MEKTVVQNLFEVHIFASLCCEAMMLIFHFHYREMNVKKWHKTLFPPWCIFIGLQKLHWFRNQTNCKSPISCLHLSCPVQFNFQSCKTSKLDKKEKKMQSKMRRFTLQEICNRILTHKCPLSILLFDIKFGPLF